MKKTARNIMLAGGIALLSLGLVACGDNSASTQKKESETVKDNSSSSETKKASFKDNLITQENGSTIKLTGSEVTNDYEGKPMLVVLFNYTNNSKEAQNLQTAFLDSVTAKQNLGDTTEELDMSIPGDNFKYQDLVDKLQADVNPKKSVKGVYYYEIKDKTKPVILEVHDTMMEKVGTKEYKINK